MKKTNKKKDPTHHHIQLNQKKQMVFETFSPSNTYNPQLPQRNLPGHFRFQQTQQRPMVKCLRHARNSIYTHRRITFDNKKQEFQGSYRLHEHWQILNYIHFIIFDHHTFVCSCLKRTSACLRCVFICCKILCHFNSLLIKSDYHLRNIAFLNIPSCKIDCFFLLHVTMVLQKGQSSIQSLYTSAENIIQQISIKSHLHTMLNLGGQLIKMHEPWSTRVGLFVLHCCH